MNVNVSYNGFSLADAASCVMMRLPVPDLVWDMEVLWKVWNEPLPAVDVPEAVPTDAQEEAEPVNQESAKAVIAELEEHIRRQMPSRAKPVTYNGVTYPSLTACAKAFGLTVSACSRRLQKGQPLDKKLKAGGRPLIPVTVNGRCRKGSRRAVPDHLLTYPQRAGSLRSEILRQVRAHHLPGQGVPQRRGALPRYWHQLALVAVPHQAQYPA